MKSWKAEAFGNIDDVLKLVDVPELAAPPPGCLTLRVLATGVGLPDVLMTLGKYPLVAKPPVSPGQEVVGIVTAVADGAAFEVGDRVLATSLFRENCGGFSEQCYVSTEFACKVPEGMPDEQAAGFIIPFQTAYAALVQRCQLLAGETLLVLGASGSSGSAAIVLGKALGATVIAVAGGEDKCTFCRSVGADYVVDYRQGPIAEQVREHVAAVDVIFDPVGGASYDDAVKAIGLHGRVALIGFGSGTWAQLDPKDMVMRSYSALGVFLARCSREDIAAAYVDLLAMYAQGKIRVPVDKVYSFSEVPLALNEVASSRLLGKHIVRVSDE
jgi:NADPH2:quinone reductase